MTCPRCYDEKYILIYQGSEMAACPECNRYPELTEAQMKKWAEEEEKNEGLPAPAAGRPRLDHGDWEALTAAVNDLADDPTELVDWRTADEQLDGVK